MPNVLMIPTASAPASLNVYGKAFTVAGGVVTCADWQAAILSANGWIQSGNATGTTAQRPASPAIGATFLDQSLIPPALVIFAGKSQGWVHHASGASA
jgi:hypothetical protein